MTPKEVLDLPAPTFWLLHRNTERLRAEEHYHLAVVTSHAGSGEGLEKILTQLRDQIGEIAVFDEGRKAMAEAADAYDREGLMALKDMGRI